MACRRLYSVPGCICFGRGLSMSRHVLRYTRRALQIDLEQCRILNKHLSIGSYRLPCFWMNSFHYLILSGIIKWIYFFLLSAVSEVIAGIFYCKKEIVQNNRQIFKQFSAGMREQEKIQIALSAVMVCWPSFLSLSVLQNSNIRNMLFMNNFVYLI